MSLANLRNLAENGDANAQYRLGLIYEQGKDVSLNLSIAHFWFQKAAENGFAEAQNKCGDYHRCDEANIAEGTEKSICWYRLAAKQSHLAARVSLAQFFMEDRWIMGSEREAVELAMQWARLKTPESSAMRRTVVAAQHFIGRCYRDGVGVHRSLGKARIWFRLAAEQGYAPAENSLALLYMRCHVKEGKNYLLTEQSEAEDLSIGMQWLLKAAANHYAPALFNLSYCHKHGYGTKRSESEHFNCIQRLRDMKLPRWMKLHLSDSLSRGTETFIDHEEMMHWIKRAAVEDSDAFARNELGYRQLFGEGTKKDIASAVENLKLAAEQGHSLAMLNVANCLKQGFISSIDAAKGSETAEGLINEALQVLSSKDDMFYFGYLLSRGINAEKDERSARSFFLRASELGHTRAMYELALLEERCDADARSVASGSPAPLHWMQKAAEGGLAAAKVTLARWQLKGTYGPIDARAARCWLESALGDNCADAFYELGCCYLQHDSIPSEFFSSPRVSTAAAVVRKSVTFVGIAEDGAVEQAVKYFLGAVSLDHIGAIAKLQEMGAIKEGSFMQFELHLRSALAGDVESQFLVGRLLHQGIGVKSNLHEACQWLEMASESDHGEAQCLLGEILLFKRCYDNSMEAALMALRSAAENDVPRAQYLLGWCYMSGTIVKRDTQAALKLFQAAAAIENADGMCAVANFYWDGVAVEFDRKRAVATYIKAMNMKATDQVLTDSTDWAMVCARVGHFYRKGMGGARDRAEAAKWYQHASYLGDVGARKFTSCDRALYAVKSSLYHLIR